LTVSVPGVGVSGYTVIRNEFDSCYRNFTLAFFWTGADGKNGTCHRMRS